MNYKYHFKVMIVIMLGYLVLCWATLTYAGESPLGAKFGLGMLGGSRTSEIKIFSLRSESPVEDTALHNAQEAGLWTDTRGDLGRKGALFYKYQVGVKPQSEHVYFKAFAGPSLQSSTDSQLGGILQISSDFGLGFQDQGSYVGLSYSHFSSAGVFKVNKGRDFFCFEAGLKW